MSIQLVKDAARDQWRLIYGDMARDLIFSHRKHQPCPVCGGRDRFRLFSDWEENGGAICNQCGAGDGFRWVGRMLCTDFITSLDYIKQVLGVTGIADQQKVDCLRKQAEIKREHKVTIESNELPQRLARLNHVLESSIDIAKHQSGISYLIKRGLGALAERGDYPDGWRGVTHLSYWDDAKESVYPALVAPVLNSEGELVNVHRTYISDDGSKAPVARPKKLMRSVVSGAMKGAAIRLYEAKGDVLALTEGIETGLAVRAAYPNVPVWAAVSAWGLLSIKLPPHVCRVYIMADKDISGVGQNAAFVLCNRLKKEGRGAEVLIPSMPIPESCKSIDWLDVLNLSNNDMRLAV